MGTSENYARFPDLPSTTPTRSYSLRKLVWSLRASPWDCSHSSNSLKFVCFLGEKGSGKKNYFRSSPGERQEGTRKGVSESQPRPQLSPRAAPARAPAAPARRPEALPLRVRLPASAPAPASRAQRPRSPPHLSSSPGWASRVRPTMWVSTRKPVASSWRVRLNGRAPHPCARQAASSGQGAAPRGHLPPACKSHFSAFHLEQGREIRGTHPRPSPDRIGALLQVLPTPRWALGTAAGLARFPASLRQPQPCLPVLAVHTQKHTTKITPLGIAPKGPGQSGRVEARKKQMRLDAETRRARSRQTCRRAAREVVLLRRAPRSGIAPGKAAPAAPPPARPHRGRRHPARTPAPAAAALASALGWERGAWPLRQVAPGAGNGSSSAARTRAIGAAAAITRSTGAGVPGPGAKREELEAQGTPSLSFTLSSPDEPAEPLLLSLPRRRGGGCRSCHSSSWSKRRTPSPCGWIPPRPASPPPGEPRPRRTQLARSAPPWRTVTPDLLR